uniref:Uncharacterized protein n=1 Tax=Dunaliella tertiolecta TaxID=3047 RepID=A0A7S3QYB3_DUNTE
MNNKEEEAATVRGQKSAPNPSVPTASSPSIRNSSGSSSTRAEHGRGQEGRTSTKRRPRQLSLCAQDSTGNQGDMEPSQEAWASWKEQKGKYTQAKGRVH